MSDDFSDSKIKIKKFIQFGVFFIFMFIFLYIVFLSKGMYDTTKNESDNSIRETRDCMGYTFDTRNIFYDKNKKELGMDFYLFGFSESSVDAVTLISDKCLKDCSEPVSEDCIGNSSLIVDYKFKKPVRPGKTDQFKVNFDADKFFCVEVKDCSVTRLKKMLN